MGGRIYRTGSGAGLQKRSLKKALRRLGLVLLFGIWIGGFWCYITEAKLQRVPLQSPSIPRPLAIPCLLPVSLGESLVPHSQHFCPGELCPQLGAAQGERQNNFAELVPPVSACQEYKGCKKPLKTKPNRPLVFVHDLRGAKEASQKQMVAFSLREKSSCDCPPAQPELQTPHLSTLQPGHCTRGRLHKVF